MEKVSIVNINKPNSLAHVKLQNTYDNKEAKDTAMRNSTKLMIGATALAALTIAGICIAKKGKNPQKSSLSSQNLPDLPDADTFAREMERALDEFASGQH